MAKFKLGDRIFAKVRGHPHWPGIVTDIEDSASKIKKYKVKFYGTNEVAYIKEIDICYFLENKSTYGKPKLKNKTFNRAMREAETSFNDSWKGKCTPSNNVDETSSSEENLFINSIDEFSTDASGLCAPARPSLTELLAPYNVEITPSPSTSEDTKIDNLHFRQENAELRHLNRVLTDKTVELEIDSEKKMKKSLNKMRIIKN